MGFQLHTQLGNDTVDLGCLSLSRVLLMKDANYPWIILVPEREGIREIFELSSQEQQVLIREISVFSRLMHEDFHADKINVAALGNMVPQLHIHLVARYTSDAAWPKPIWGAVSQKLYSDEALLAQVARVEVLVSKVKPLLS